MGIFKIAAKVKKKSQAKSFRLPADLLEAMSRIAKKNQVSVNELANQMLRHCVEEQEKSK